ncbi:MAG: hypothetical protein NTV01_06425 [Bacteroidia bacterium]|nr:hypothetical protein [Bacteroidia bacterium]
MEDIIKQIEILFEKAVDYGKTTIELAKLKAIDRISDIAASIIVKIVTGVVLFLFLLFASLGLALWLGEVLGKIYLGFLAVAAIYGVFAILAHLFLNRWIKKLICNFIIKKALY